MTEREFVYFSHWYTPTQDFKDFLTSIDRSADEISSTVTDLNFLPEVIQYVKDHDNWAYYQSKRFPAPIASMRGDRSSFYKIGFSGVADVLKVDTDRKWIVKFYSGDMPYVAYVEVDVNEYGYCTIRRAT